MSILIAGWITRIGRVATKHLNITVTTSTHQHNVSDLALAEAAM
jgi:hypothetical protein